MIFSCFLNENEFELRNEPTCWHVDLEADQLAGPVAGGRTRRTKRDRAGPEECLSSHGLQSDVPSRWLESQTAEGLYERIGE